MPQDGSSANLDQRFGFHLGLFGQPRAQPACEDDDFQGMFLTIEAERS
jgi:hypothetical protein